MHRPTRCPGRLGVHLLRFGEVFEPGEDRRAQSMDRRERQFHLGLDTFELDDQHARGLPRGVPQQRGLPDARLATDDQHGALAVAGLSEHARRAVGTRLCGRGSPSPGWQASSYSKGSLKQALGLNSRLAAATRRGTCSTASGGAVPTVMPRSRNCRAIPSGIRSAVVLTITPVGRTCRAACSYRSAAPSSVVWATTSTPPNAAIDSLNSRWTSRSSARSARTATMVPSSAVISATVASAVRLIVEVDHDDGPRPARQPERDIAAGSAGAARDDHYGSPSIGGGRHHQSIVEVHRCLQTGWSDTMPHAPVDTRVRTRGQGQGGGPKVAGGIATRVLRRIYPRHARGSAGVTRMRKEQPLDQQHEPSTRHVHDK